MSKTMLKCFAVSLALGFFPAAAIADETAQSPSSTPYQGPLPAGGAMTHEVAGYWYNNQAVEIGAGVLLVGGLIALLANKNGNSTPATTATH